MDINFSNFTGRDEALKNIKRFNMPRFTPMFYRTNLLVHSNRVYFMVNDAAPLASMVSQEFDPEKARTLAHVHDDAEILTGDIQVYYKDRMTPEELAQLDQQEANAIEELSQQFPETINGYNYRSLLHHSLNKDCVESQLVSWMDKLDALCECIHEIRAGNSRYIGPARNYLENKLPPFPDNYPTLQPILDIDHPLLNMPQALHLDHLLNMGREHSQRTVLQESAIPYYDHWKNLTIKHFGIEELTTRRES